MKELKIYLAIALSFVPSALVILLQMVCTFGSGDGGVEIDWLDVISTNWGLQTPVILFKYVTFPLVFALLYWNKIKRDEHLRLTWLLWGVGLLEMAMLAEVGERRYHCNFQWGLVTASFLLMAVSVAKYMEYRRTEKSKLITRTVCDTILIAELFCGLEYVYWYLTIDWFWA